MSEYTPITDGLRESMARMHVFGRPMVQKEEADFNRMCDAIDSVHAALEGENEMLRAWRLLDNRYDSMQRGDA